MDPSSIITQVKEDGGDSTEKDSNPANASAVATELPPIRSWRRRYGRLLRSLLCCVGGAEGCARRRDLLYRAAGGACSSSRPLLPPARPADARRVCAVVDLDETLVHSSFQPVRNADFVIPVEIDGVTHSVYVLKRPHVDEFLTRMNQMFECVLFTASIAKYADPVVDLLDPAGVFGARLFRDACAVHRSNFVKDLAKLGRALSRVVIVDNSPNSYIFHPNNAVAVSSWFGATDDVELLTCLPILERISAASDVYDILGQPSRQGNHAVPQPPPPALSPSPVSSDALSQPAEDIT